MPLTDEQKQVIYDKGKNAKPITEDERDLLRSLLYKNTTKKDEQ